VLARQEHLHSAMIRAALDKITLQRGASLNGAVLMLPSGAQ